MRTHHDKHHAKYVEVLNGLLKDKTQSGESPASLEDVVKAAATGSNRKLFNNAAQAWNHGFFWESMTPQASQPGGELANAIDKAFGGVDGTEDQVRGRGCQPLRVRAGPGSSPSGGRP